MLLSHYDIFKICQSVEGRKKVCRPNLQKFKGRMLVKHFKCVLGLNTTAIHPFSESLSVRLLLGEGRLNPEQVTSLSQDHTLDMHT